MVRAHGKILFVTNNVRIHELCLEGRTIKLLESYEAVLHSVRDYIHQGYMLLTHPMSGSLKPNQTPFKTIIIEKRETDSLDFESLTLIEHALDTYYKFEKCHKLPQWGDKALEDFRTVDMSFMKSAIQRL